jgi:hypothetical protein
LQYSPIDTSQFVDILVTQGLYKKSSPSAVEAIANVDDQSDSNGESASSPQSSGATSREHETPMSASLDQRISQNSAPDPETFIKYLNSSPREALDWLIRLPPVLGALDFATKILTSNALDGTGISPDDIAREHLQHMLRHVEAMGAQDRDSRQDGGLENEDGSQHSTEEQARAVTLITVYIQNLLARQIVNYESISLDLQEICVRYIWLPRVRDFRTWLQMSIGSSGSLASDLSL